MPDTNAKNLENTKQNEAIKKRSFFGGEINAKTKDLLDFRYNTQEEIDKLNDEMTTTSDLDEIIQQTNSDENNESINSESEEYLREKDEKEAESGLEENLGSFDESGNSDNTNNINLVEEPIEGEIVENPDEEKDEDGSENEDNINKKDDVDETLKNENVVEEDMNQKEEEKIEEEDNKSEENEVKEFELGDSAKFFDPFELSFNEDDENDEELPEGNNEIFDPFGLNEDEDISENNKKNEVIDEGEDEDEIIDKEDSVGEQTNENDDINEDNEKNEVTNEDNEEEINNEEIVGEENDEGESGEQKINDDVYEEYKDEENEIEEESERDNEEKIEEENVDEDDDEPELITDLGIIDDEYEEDEDGENDNDEEKIIEDEDNESDEIRNDNNDNNEEGNKITDEENNEVDESEDENNEVEFEKDDEDENEDKNNKKDEIDEDEKEDDDIVINAPIPVNPNQKDEKKGTAKEKKVKKNSATGELVTEEEIQLEQGQDMPNTEDDEEYQPSDEEIFEQEPEFFGDDELSQQFMHLVQNVREIFKLERRDGEQNPYFKILGGKTKDSTIEYLFYLIEEEFEPIDLYIKKVETNQGEENEHLVQFSYNEDKELNIFVDEVILYEKINKSDSDNVEYNDTKAILEKFIFLTDNHYDKLKAELDKIYEEKKKKRQLQQIFKGF